MENKPTYNAYTVHNNEDTGKSFWTKIGAGFDHGDGDGMSLYLDCLPRNGRVVLRKTKDEVPA